MRVGEIVVFEPFGFVSFVGEMGSGKSLSMCKLVDTLMRRYSKCLLITNLRLNTFPYDNKRIYKYHSFNDFYNYDNGFDGIIFMIDELQVEANNIDKLSSNDSKTLNLFLTQLRSKHILIVATSPIYSRLAKLFRENFMAIVICHCKSYRFFKVQCNTIIDRTLQSDDFVITGNIDFSCTQSYSFVRRRADYERYDTFACQGIKS